MKKVCKIEMPNLGLATGISREIVIFSRPVPVIFLKFPVISQCIFTAFFAVILRNFRRCFMYFLFNLLKMNNLLKTGKTGIFQEKSFFLGNPNDQP